MRAVTFRLLSQEEAFTLFVAAVLCGSGKIRNVDFAGILQEYGGSGGLNRVVIDRILPSGVRRRRLIDAAEKTAEQWIASGRWAAQRIASVSDCFPPACVPFFFGEGEQPFDRPWAACFNSRKPRLVSPADPWLCDLRDALSHIARQGVGIASSFGTMTYDLVSLWADSGNLPLLAVCDSNPERSDPERSGMRRSFGPQDALRPVSSMWCGSVLAGCSRGMRRVCRDRLLAVIADFRYVVDVREGGNLAEALQCGTGEVLRPEVFRGMAFGAVSIIESNGRSLEHDGAEEPGQNVVNDANAFEIVPERYLYHYTRSCPGPWPGQPYREYLLGLLNDAPLAGHTAVETLAHILNEGLLRGGTGLVKGNAPVISWTSVPPGELESVRQWNPALMRWTFEPYGIAVERKFLKRLGAKPVIYTDEAGWEKIAPVDRFRRQARGVGDRWKREREWRLSGDFPLDVIPPEAGFIFVRSTNDAKLIRKWTRYGLPVVVSENGALFLSRRRCEPSPDD